MMSDIEGSGQGPLLRRVLNWALVYGAWLLCSALALLALLVLRRCITSLHIALRLSKWSLGLLDKWGLFALGLVALTAILYTQYYFTQAYPGGDDLGAFPRRFVRVLLIELGVLGVSGALLLVV